MVGRTNHTEKKEIAIKVRPFTPGARGRMILTKIEITRVIMRYFFI